MARRSPERRDVGRWQVEGDVVELAVATEGRWIAMGLVDGDTAVYPADQIQSRAILEGHTGRVASITFSTDGRWLPTASWHKTLRAWSLAELSEPAEALRTRVESARGRTAEDVLDPDR